MERGRGSVDVVRVDQERLGHRLSRSGHSRQHEHPGIRELTRHELFGNQIHPIAKRCNQRDVCIPVEPREPLGWY